MSKRNAKLASWLLAALLVSASVALMATLAFPVAARPSSQNGQDFATPTLSPVELDPVAVTQVGGALEKVTYPAETLGDFAVGNTFALSNYPHGATFTVSVKTDKIIQGITLFARYPHRSGTRAVAEQTDTPGEWKAVLYDRPGQPPWQEFDFYWSITAEDSSFVETTPQHFVYNDPTRVWFKAETPLLRLYWFGYDESFAQVAMEGIAAVQERYLLGFGQPLSYVPVAVLFADVESFAEFSSGGVTGAQQRAGFTSNELGMTVQRFIEIGLPRGCSVFPSISEQTVEWLYAYTTEVITHEVAHLYQFENNINGPTWFIEGGATWFSMESFRVRQEGLRDRDSDDDLPTLQGSGPSSGSFTPNGCNALAYWMGASFYNYIYGAYGMDAIGTWLGLIGQTYRMDEALLQATGKTLSELEHDWRIYLGLTPEVFVMPTDEYRFPPTVTPFGQ